MKHRFLQPAVAAALLVAAAHASAQVTFYEGEGFRGRVFATDHAVGNLDRVGYNDRASSAIVAAGRWEVCDDAGYQGHCVVLRRGNYDSLRSFGLDRRISSVRPVAQRPQYPNEVPPPPIAPVYEYRQRPSEQLFSVPVISARAVVGPPEQRCWVERQQVADAPRSDISVPGGVIGGVLGGILGHQIGGGSGNTVATIGGAVGGAALGANVNRLRDGGTATRDVQRCQTTSNSGPPQYWDVAYDFRGVQHHAQMSAAPGPTIVVNGRGEPRQ